jgi:hypothetical protein
VVAALVVRVALQEKVEWTATVEVERSATAERQRRRVARAE